MKITSIKVLSANRYDYVKVETDEGISGVGELHPASGTSGTPYASRAGVNYHSEYLMGKDPNSIENNWQHMFRRQIFRGGSDVMAALGAIDMALWDIKGKSLNKPVNELLGGPVRDKIRLYTHLSGTTPEELRDESKEMVEQGFTALRFYPFGNFGNRSFAEGTGLEKMSYTSMQRYAVERVKAVRESVGPDIDLMIDVVNRLTPPEAIGIGNALADFNLYFFEDPIEPENMDAWEQVASRQPIPIAMGERLYTIYQFRDLLNHNGASYLRPDPSLVGGITNVMKIGALAQASYVSVVPHNPLSCVLTAACAQIDGVLQNVPLQEYPRDDNTGIKADLVKEPLKREGGYLIIPDKPGLGIELNEEAFQHYPVVAYDRPPMIYEDGSLKDY